MRASEDKKYRFIHIVVDVEPGIHSVMLPRDFQWKRLRFEQGKLYFYGLDRKDGSARTKEYKFEIIESDEQVSDKMDQCYVENFASPEGRVFHMFEA